MDSTAIRSTLKGVRKGKTYRNGFLAISIYNESSDTFLVDNLVHGVCSRNELSAYQVRNLLRDIE